MSVRASVRRGEARDVLAMARIAREVLDDPWSERQLAEEVERSIARVFVAEVEGAVAGFAVTWHVADEVSLLLIAVERRVEGQGVGRALLAALEATAIAEGMALVLLEVRAKNQRARDFYQRAGYLETGLRRGYYGGGADDAVLMQRALT